MKNRRIIVAGIEFPPLLALLFIGLKLTGHIDWPWLWVVSPLWLPVAAIPVTVIGVLFLFLFSLTIILVISEGFDTWEQRQ